MQPINKRNNLYIGTLSGTSMDSIDASLIKITKKIKVIESFSLKMPKVLLDIMAKLSRTKKNLFLYPLCHNERQVPSDINSQIQSQ